MSIKDWTPKKKSSTPKWLQNIVEQWDARAWREPDKILEDGYRYIWYGPDGEEGDYATEVEFDDDEYTVSEYTNVVGLIENPDWPILKTTTKFTVEELLTALVEAKTKAYIWSAIEQNPAAHLRMAAGYGVAKISYYGGDEEGEEQLPS